MKILLGEVMIEKDITYQELEIEAASARRHCTQDSVRAELHADRISGEDSEGPGYENL